MIIVPIKEGENIERALKKFKRKFEKTGVVRELRNRKTFVKPSVARRDQLKKAIYVQQLRHGVPASNKPHPAEKSTPVWLAIWRTWAGFANSQLRRAAFRSTY